MGKFQAEPDADRSARPAEPTAEEISLWMDGELDAERGARAGEGCREATSIATWECYHVIGDVLRGCKVNPGFSARLAARLAAEPTVQSRLRPAAAAVAWALAASLAAIAVVGWVALNTMQVSPPTAIATAERAATVHAADVRRPVVNEYLLAHQEYSPTTAIQGVRPYLRAVATESDKPDAPE